jgi:L-rhamnose mutarotase
MILKNRIFERKEPSREAKSFYIFCEGNSREPEYLLYFKEIDSKINVEVIRAEFHDNNSPTGLYDKACLYVLSSDENPNPKFELLDIDEVWFVIDTDKWGSKIEELREKCKRHRSWFIAQSNPCFEVWLYYHFNQNVPIFEGIEISKNWKKYVNSIIKGGFDPRKHPVFIGDAIKNAQDNYVENNGNLDLCSTEMYKLGKNIYPLIEKTILDGLRKIEK